MANDEEKIDPGEGGTGSLDLNYRLRVLLTDIIKNCPKKREEIAEQMGRLLDRSVSVHMLNTFTAESREGHRFPAEWIPAFCVVTGDFRLLDLIARMAGLHVVSQAEFELIQFGRTHLKREAVERELDEIRKRLHHEDDER